MSINKACELSPFTKQAYFKSRKRTTTKVEQLELATEYIVRRVKELRKDLEKSGGLKMYALLKEELVAEGYKVHCKLSFSMFCSAATPPRKGIFKGAIF